MSSAQNPKRSRTPILFLFLLAGIYSDTLRAENKSPLLDSSTTTPTPTSTTSANLKPESLSGFGKLPDDVKSTVLKYSDLKTRGAVAQVDKQSNAIAEDYGKQQALKYVNALKARDPNLDPVRQAILDDRPDVIRYLPASVPSSKLYSPDADRKTPLHLAASRGNEKAVEALVKRLTPEQILEKDEVGATLLHRLTIYDGGQGPETLAKHLSYDQRNERTKYGHTAFHTAIYNGNVPAVKAFIQLDPEKLWNQNHGEPFRHAARVGRVEIVEELTHHMKKEHMNEKDRIEGRTPLHWAAVNGDAGIIKILAKHLTQEQLHQKDYSGRTALELAQGSNKSEAVEELNKHLLPPSPPPKTKKSKIAKFIDAFKPKHRAPPH